MSARTKRLAASLRAVGADLDAESASLAIRPEPYARAEAAASARAAAAAHAAAASGDLARIIATLLDPYAAGDALTKTQR